jgi:hypothetical protein
MILNGRWIFLYLTDITEKKNMREGSQKVMNIHMDAAFI